MWSYKMYGVVIDMFRHQLDMKRWFVSESISTCILGTMVFVKSTKFDGYTDSEVTTFMVCSNTGWTIKWPKEVQLKEHWTNCWAVAHDKIIYKSSRYTFYITPQDALASNQMYVSRGSVTTFMLTWYNCGMSLHLQTAHFKHVLPGQLSPPVIFICALLCPHKMQLCFAEKF